MQRERHWSRKLNEMEGKLKGSKHRPTAIRQQRTSSATPAKVMAPPARKLRAGTHGDRPNGKGPESNGREAARKEAARNTAVDKTQVGPPMMLGRHMRAYADPLETGWLSAVKRQEDYVWFYLRRCRLVHRRFEGSAGK